MNESTRDVLALEPIAGDAEVGRWLAAMEDARRDTLRELETVTPRMLDWRPGAPMNSIGMLLYHVALVEAAWLLEDIFENDPGPEWLGPLLPFESRDGSGHLSQIEGEPLATHLERLAAIRRLLLERMTPMSNADFHRVRHLEQYDAAPDWILHHLLQHEAEHRAHIAWMRDTFPG